MNTHFRKAKSSIAAEPHLDHITSEEYQLHLNASKCAFQNPPLNGYEVLHGARQAKTELYGILFCLSELQKQILNRG